MRYIIFLLLLGACQQPTQSVDATDYHNKSDGIEADTINKKLYFYGAPGGKRIDYEVYDIYDWEYLDGHLFVTVTTDSGMYIKASFFKKYGSDILWGVKY